MDIKLWHELNDQQAEKVSAGAGFGTEVSSFTRQLIGDAKEFGFHGLNITARAFFGTNFGTPVSQNAPGANKS
jgi:hypothetical protein